MSSSSVVQGAYADDGMHFTLSSRTDRPIEGCEILAHPFLFLKGGALDNASRAKVMDNNPHKFTYRWFRGPRRQLCQSEQCPRGSTYDPVFWSKAAVGGASLQCAICAKAGIAGHHSLFCSARYHRVKVQLVVLVPLQSTNCLLTDPPFTFSSLLAVLNQRGKTIAL